MSIQLTYTFASHAELEAHLAALRGAVHASPEVAKGAAPKAVQAPAPAASQATAKAGDAPKKTDAAKTPAAESAATEPQASTAATGDAGNAAAGSSAQATPDASTASSSEPVEYPVLQKAVFALAAKSRDAASALVASFGVKTFKDLESERWAEALAAVKKKLEELEAA